MPAPCISLECGAKGKLKTHQAIKAIYAEALRHPMPSGLRYTENVDPHRSEKNLVWINPRWRSSASEIPDYEKAIRELMQERTPKKKPRKIRKDAVLVRSMIFQVSPIYFFPKLETWSQKDIDLSKYNERGYLDIEKVNLFMEAMKKHLDEEYGDTLLSYELHLDENCPHLHVQVIPMTVDGRMDSKNLFNETGIKSKIDRASKAVAHLGIIKPNEKGRRNNNPKEHGDFETYRERERQKELSLKQDKPRYDSIPEGLLPPKLPEEPEPPQKPSLFASQEEKEEYREQLKIYREELEEYEKKSSPKWRAEEQKKKILEKINRDAETHNLLREKVLEAQKEAKAARAAAEAAEKRARSAEAAALKAIPLTEVIERIYPEFTQDPRDKSIWKTQDGRKIGISSQLFIDNHDQSFKGKGGIDFIIHQSKCSVKEAIGILRDYFGTTETLRHIATTEPEKLAPIIESAPSRPEPTAPAPDSTKEKILRSWMVREQKLSPKTTDFLLQSGQIYADSSQNVVVPRLCGGAFLRGTVRLKSGEKNSFKRTLGSKRAGPAQLRGPEATPPTVTILCEGITDAIALVELYPDAVVYITGGNLRPILPSITPPILLAFDTDQAGQEHAAFYAQLFPDTKAITPPEGKDWAEYLKQKKEEAQEELSDFMRTTAAPSHAPRPR